MEKAKAERVARAGPEACWSTRTSSTSCSRTRLWRWAGDVVMERPYELDWTPDGMVARVRLRGHGVLAAPLLNRGTAFTPDEREKLGLTGLLPDAVSTMEGQLARAYGQYLRQPDDLSRNLYLATCGTATRFCSTGC